MATFGLKTFKSDGTTVVLQNSTTSAVFGQIFTLTDAGTGATRNEPIPTRPGFSYYYKDFPEYITRTIRPFQLRPGQHSWELGTLNGIPYIKWSRNVYVPADAGIYIPEFLYTDTVLYVFVK
jgi:hypothetical protein